MKTLYDIQPGDQVLCKSNYTTSILTVDRVTSTLIICQGTKFRKQDGNKIPHERWHFCYITILTDELKIEFYKKAALSQNIQLIKTTNWKCMSEEVINQIADIIKQNQK